MTVEDPKAFLTSLFEAAVEAADPMRVIAQFLPEPPKGRTIVLGAGKAAAAMAKAVETHWRGPLEGLVVTRYGHDLPEPEREGRQIEVVEAAHPVPDAAGERAAARILALAREAGPDDLVLCLISGGGSSLLSLPAPGLSLEDKQAVNRALLKSGASIGEMNCLRKHLSSIKGGRLAAAAHPAKVVSLLISDVPGDGAEVIASGPTVPDPTSCADACAILEKYKLKMPGRILELLAGEGETPKPDHPAFAGNEVHLIARPQDSLEAAARHARESGITPLILGDAIEGEAREAGRVMAGIARQVLRHDQPVGKPCVLLSGGETTVTIAQEAGRGGRNVEFLLGLTLELLGEAGVFAIACDTDGIDGSEDNAGAYCAPDTLARAAALELSARDYLARHDAYSFYAALDDLIVTGPTHTNVNDFRAILVRA